MKDDVTELLESLGLGQYAAVFATNDITLELMTDLTEQDLREMGVSLGHRKLLLRAIGIRSGASLATQNARRERVERRQLTVLFCDMVGSTALSIRYDPEDLREVLSEFQSCCRSVVEAYGGHVARYMGDALLVYFGYPEAHEDDPERALRAGRELIPRIGKLEVHPDIRLSIRVGVATGPVVVGDLIGDGMSQEHSVVGKTPNLAARLQQIAEPNEIATTDLTKQLAGPLFAYRSLGMQEFKGFDSPVRVWAVGDELAIENRFAAAHSEADVLPVVGRESEIGELMAIWNDAVAVRGGSAIIMGEPGLGKSRLILGLRERLNPDSYTLLQHSSVAYYAETALYPLIAQLERTLTFERNDDELRKLGRIEAMVERLGMVTPRSVQLLAALLSVSIENRMPQLDLSPRAQKEQTFAVLEEYIVRLAVQRPVLLVFEDLHWVDPTTLELLDRLIDTVSDLPVFLLMSARPEFILSWPESQCTRIELVRIGDEETIAMLQNLTGGKALPDELVRAIVEKTDGVPLFIEELTKSMLESGQLAETADSFALVGTIPRLSVPDTLKDSLMARLDRLQSAKNIAQVGAAIGRRFSLDLLGYLLGEHAGDVESSLEKLVEAKLISRSGGPPNVNFAFKHALIQDAAYSSLLRRERRELHGKIADALASQFAEKLHPRPELLAHHYTRAERFREAINNWRLAGDEARSRAAHKEAIKHLETAMVLIPRILDEHERDQLEIQLRIPLGINLEAVGGYASDEVQRTYARIAELCTKLGRTTEQVPALLGLNVFHLVRAEHAVARDLAREAVALCDGTEQNEYLIDALAALGHVLAYCGEIKESVPVLTRCVGLKRPGLSVAPVPITAQDPAVLSLALLGVVDWALGFPDRALRRIDDARSLAAELAHPINESLIGPYAATVHQLRGEPQLAAECARTGMELARTHGYDYWQILSMTHFGIANGTLGVGAESAALIERGISALRTSGAQANITYFLLGRAEAELASGDVDRALASISEAITQADSKGENLFRAGLYQMRAEANLRRPLPDPQAAEADLRLAIEIAESQQAMSFKLRAATSLYRLHANSDCRSATRNLLAETLDFFSEGLDTRDLRAARSLLGGT